MAKRKDVERRSTTWGLAPLGAVLPRAVRRRFQRRGFAQAAVLTQWREIVGGDIAASSCPERLSFPRGRAEGGTLRIRVAGGLALELQHLEPVLIERLNAFFGAPTVARLALVQGPLPAPRPAPSRPQRRALSAAEESQIDAAVAPAADPALRSALRSLARARRQRSPASRAGRDMGRSA